MRAPVRRHLAPAFAVLLMIGLTACVPGQPLTVASGLDALRYETLSSYAAAPGRAGVLHRDRRSGALSIDVLGTNGRAPLPAFTDARIVHVSHNGNDQVAVIQGSSPSCPTDYQIVATDSSTVSWTNPFGTCTTPFQTIDTQHGLLMIQQGVQDPLFVSYNGRKLTAPMLKSTLDAEAAAQRSRTPAAPRGPVRPAPAQHPLTQQQLVVASHVAPATSVTSSPALQHVSADQLPKYVPTTETMSAPGDLPSFNPE